MEKEFTEYRIEVSVAPGALCAQVKVVPTVSEVALIDEGDVHAALSEGGVVFGILPDAIRSLVEGKILGSAVEVARGEPAGEGRDGCVRFLFEKHGRKVELKEDASGRVNFKDMNLIQNVRKGDLLCELVPPESGADGVSVRGEPLQGRLGAAAKLPGGKNVETA